MRFGIPDHEEKFKAAQDALDNGDAKRLVVGVRRKDVPSAAEKEHLGLWILQSLGILTENDHAEHPAITILLELVKRRNMGEGVSGREMVELVKLKKTQLVAPRIPVPSSSGSSTKPRVLMRSKKTKGSAEVVPPN